MSDSTTVAAMSNRRGIRCWRACMALVALSGVVAGCSPDTAEPGDRTAGPSVSRSATPAPTPTPTPTPTVEGVLADGVKPERPTALDEPPTIDGAIAVLTYYLKLYPYAQNTGDLADIRSLSHPECAFCTSVIDSIEELGTLGLHSIGGAVLVEDATGTEVTPGRWFSVDLRTMEAASQELRADGSVAEEFAASVYTMNAALIYEEGAWKLRELSHEEIVQ
jgi:hypothetical protein